MGNQIISEGVIFPGKGMGIHKAIFPLNSVTVWQIQQNKLFVPTVLVTISLSFPASVSFFLSLPDPSMK